MAAEQAQEFKIRGFVQPYNDSISEIGTQIKGDVITFKPLSEAYYALNVKSLEEQGLPSDGGSNNSGGGLEEEEVVTAVTLVETTGNTDPELVMTMLTEVLNDDTELEMKLNLKGTDAALTG